jgi:hypothetical protein
MSQSTPTAATYDTRVEIVRPTGTQIIPASEGDTFTFRQHEIWSVEPTGTDLNDAKKTYVDSLVKGTSVTLSKPPPPLPILMPKSAEYLPDEEEIITAGSTLINRDTGRYEHTIDLPSELQSFRPGETLAYKHANCDLQTVQCPETPGSHLELRPPQLDVSTVSPATGTVTPSSYTLGNVDKVTGYGKKELRLVPGRSYFARDGRIARRHGSDAGHPTPR